ncbi:hypothetical protein HUT16_01385 [Kitasatospora sp. NA04385]|uniref:hypothetical protein n=1 Tax=Kitasatospora sp. NA04385 TaxID=2742135 RepID=UPI001590B8C2|nr:hypothetical protein [Kitasatospora sp. NA04385]QKW17641.1 hypothetical protein HUT16_01385 [Kitasatospora sp. NA04385]
MAGDTSARPKKSCDRACVDTWLTDWNDNPHPFIWTKTADEILDKVAAYHQRIPGSGH